MLAGGAHAQRPVVSPTRLPAGARVVVDGELDEPLWREVAQLGALTQTEPVEGAPTTMPTEVRLAYDEDFFYLGVLCHDDPAEVRARQRDRDAFVRYDDVIEFWFDTFHDQRFAFWFQITAGGSRGDALLADSGSSFNKDWDGIWYGRSKVTDQGWQAEIALPFKTLAFPDGQHTWGFNFRRRRVANGDDSRWASPFVAYRFFNLAEGGELAGMRGMHQGWGLDVVPYVKGALGRDRGADPGADFKDTYDAGLDISWRPTPSTTLRVTFNTDFAETEVDERRVNLTRFPLFFPEKRDFFLEDAGVFEFGVPASRRSGGGGGGGGRRAVLPFFSRTIGRDSGGEAVPILTGVKFTGRLGNWNLGLLETRVDDFVDGGLEVGQKTLGVVRLSRNLGGESAAGLILTHGRPDAAGGALTVGGDFRLGSSRFFGEGRSGSLWGYYVRTDNDGQDSGAAYGLQARARSSSWDHTLQYFASEEDYDPKLGFVRRTGVDHHRYSAEYTWRGGPQAALRQYEWSIRPHWDTDRTGREDLLQIPVKWFDIEFQSEDSISFETQRSEERLDDGFDLSDDVFVSPGEYDMVTHTLRFGANERRIFTGSLIVEWGDFFSGDILRTRFSPVVIPSGLFTWRLSYEDIDISLVEGDFETQVISSDFDFSFDPDLSWTNLLQFDTETDDLAWQSRLHWIVEPGQDLFLVGLFGWDRSGRESFTSTTAELAVKFSYTWRF